MELGGGGGRRVRLVVGGLVVVGGGIEADGVRTGVIWMIFLLLPGGGGRLAPASAALVRGVFAGFDEVVEEDLRLLPAVDLVGATVDADDVEEEEEGAGAGARTAYPLGLLCCPLSAGGGSLNASSSFASCSACGGRGARSVEGRGVGGRFGGGIVVAILLLMNQVDFEKQKTQKVIS